MPWWTTVFSSTNAATICGLPETKEEPESETGRTDKYAGKEGVMLRGTCHFSNQWPRIPFSNYRWDEYTEVQWRLGSDKAESRSWWKHYIIYDGAPAHHSPADPGQNTELKKLPPYSPFLNIAEESINALKAAIKADISRPQM